MKYRRKVRRFIHDNSENSSRAAVTEADVREIRALADRFSTSELAMVFPLSKMQIARIVNRTAWRNVL